MEEALDWAADNLTTVLLTGVVVVIAGVIVSWLKPDPEAAVDYEIPLPEQCRADWKGEVLENPSLKVCPSSDRSSRLNKKAHREETICAS